MLRHKIIDGISEILKIKLFRGGEIAQTGKNLGDSHRVPGSSPGLDPIRICIKIYGILLVVVQNTEKRKTDQECEEY